ncbi:SDR family NAD(P)-dependent oxidoreductase [Alloalcanivorax mobilis]|uniref:SDR family NAD(P)-dependent oxidoreductase n=1 Tax=Alloalcanivorax mobilis TaxID=2019569 RepID=UPI000B5B2AC2|nr:SDR family oxidoreductase [Alloalcanivorax mobilis]ASK32905.1 short-chain dehydrogenase [Alcanivorax sp. N3-2A]ASK36723.1 short-chain dehydrogenase [Alcanivorax sp. N3-2A]
MTAVIVTGGSRGIGAAICERFAADGYQVLVLDPLTPEHPHASEHRVVDVADSVALRKEVTALGNLYPVTCLVNNAGVALPADLESTTDEQINRIFAINLRGSIAATQAVLPALRRAGGGSVVHIGSRTALGKKLRTAYSTSKAGLIGMARTMALELAGDNITVNCVAPGPIRTAGFEGANPADSDATRAIIDGVPLRRMGEPADVADAVAFFAAAGFVTGQVLYVCGGITVGAAPM